MHVVQVLFGATPVFRGLGALGVAALATWQDTARWGLAAMLVFTASAHFTRMRGDLVAWCRHPPRLEALVTLTGIPEPLAAAGILLPETRSPRRSRLIAPRGGDFAANVSAARRELTLNGKPVIPSGLRVPMQILFLGVAWWTTLLPGSRA